MDILLIWETDSKRNNLLIKTIRKETELRPGKDISAPFEKNEKRRIHKTCTEMRIWQ